MEGAPTKTNKKMKKLILMLLVLVGGVMQANADDYKLHGSWDYSHDATFINGVATVTLAANTTYAFKFYTGNTWYGNGGTMTWYNCSGWGFGTSSGDCHIVSTDAGTYTFTLSGTSLTVTYPAFEGKVYFYNNLEWSQPYVYILGSSYWDSDKGSGSKDRAPAIAMTKIGETNVWQASIPSSFSGTIAFLKDEQNGYQYFDNTCAVYRDDFNQNSALFVPNTTASNNNQKNKHDDKYVQYYDGLWYAYPTYTRTVTPGNFGTICFPFAATVEGATVFKIVGKTVDANSNLTGINLESVDVLVAGHAYIFKATGTTLTATFSGNYSDAVAADGMVGNITEASHEVTKGAGYYVLGGNKLHKVIEGGNGKVTIGRYKAYIDPSAINVASAPSFSFIGVDDATGIENFEAEKIQGVTYNLQGQRVTGTQKGVFIINGKKVVVK